MNATLHTYTHHNNLHKYKIGLLYTHVKKCTHFKKYNDYSNNYNSLWVNNYTN